MGGEVCKTTNMVLHTTHNVPGDLINDIDSRETYNEDFYPESEEKLAARLDDVTPGDSDHARPAGLIDNTRLALRESMQTGRKVRRSVR